MPEQKQKIDYLLIMMEKDGVIQKGEDQSFLRELLMQSGEVDRLFDLYSKNLNI